MSANKHRSLSRRLTLLRRAERYNERGGIVFHREGGMAMSNPDVQRLIRDGLMVFRRGRPTRDAKPLSPKKFVRNFRKDFNHYVIPARPQAPGCRPTYPSERGGGIHGGVNVTRGVITDEGRAFVSRYSNIPDCEERDDPYYD